MIKKPKSAILYARFSPRRNEEICESCETQIELIHKWCEANGYQVEQVFEDKALSGGDEERPGLWQAVSALKKNYTLVIYKLDRLARSVYLSYIIEQEVKKRGAFIVSTLGEGTNGDSPEDQLTRTVLRALDEYVRKANAARTKAAMLLHQKQGRRMSDKTPYGWTRDIKNPAMMVEDAYEQAVIERVRALRGEGKAYREICRCLVNEGLKPRGKTWCHTQIKSIIYRGTG